MITEGISSFGLGRRGAFRVRKVTRERLLDPLDRRLWLLRHREGAVQGVSRGSSYRISYRDYFDSRTYGKKAKFCSREVIEEKDLKYSNIAYARALSATAFLWLMLNTGLTITR